MCVVTYYPGVKHDCSHVLFAVIWPPKGTVTNACTPSFDKALPVVNAGSCQNSYSTEMCSGSEAGSYSRLIDVVYHSNLGLRVMKKKKKLSRFLAC